MNLRGESLVLAAVEVRQRGNQGSLAGEEPVEGPDGYSGSPCDLFHGDAVYPGLVESLSGRGQNTFEGSTAPVLNRRVSNREGAIDLGGRTRRCCGHYLTVPTTPSPAEGQS
jgi:hypothetical protein